MLFPGIGTSLPITCWEMSLCSRLTSLQDRIPTCGAFQQSEEERPQGYPKDPGTWEASLVAAASTLPAGHTPHSSGARPFRECLLLPLQSGARLLLFLSPTPAIFRSGDCLFPARVRSSGHSQVLIDGCRWLQGMAQPPCVQGRKPAGTDRQKENETGRACCSEGCPQKLAASL